MSILCILDFYAKNLLQQNESVNSRNKQGRWAGLGRGGGNKADRLGD